MVGEETQVDFRGLLRKTSSHIADDVYPSRKLVVSSNPFVWKRTRLLPMEPLLADEFVASWRSVDKQQRVTHAPVSPVFVRRSSLGARRRCCGAC